MDLGFFPAVNPALRQITLAYDFARHEHYDHLRSCEHGLSSTTKSCSDYPNVM